MQESCKKTRQIPKKKHYWRAMSPQNYNFSKGLEDIILSVRKYHPNFGKKEENTLREVYKFGKDAHYGQKRASGEPFFIHGVEATKILLSILPDLETIQACLLHDVLEETTITAQEIEEKFGPKVRFLCEGVQKISKVHLLKKHDSLQQFENIQKLFVAVSQDIRVIFVKLADRIHNLQTIKYLPKERADFIANESQNIYAPVAAKFGLFRFKNEIEDLCLCQLKPQIYNQLNQEISDLKKEKSESIEKSKQEIIKIFAKSKLKIIEIQGRQKNIASVYNKMKQKNLTSVSEIYDLLGFRVIVPNKEDCYQALGILHSTWKPIPNRFKDYIAVAKSNGYRSLHTTLLGVGGNKIPTEIQIRTAEMNIDAKFGPASHWAYKKAGHSHFDRNYLQRMDWFPQELILKEKASPEKFFEELSTSVFADQVYVFTPKGDIENLPLGSTPIDFAYAIHSNVGNNCIGAKVNGAIKPLDYQLQNGEIVEILTKKGRTPNPAWLNFAKSSSARSHIKLEINKGLIKNTKAPTEIIKSLLSEARNKRRHLSLNQNKKDQDIKIIIGGERNIPYRIANCCKPKYGQSILGYKSRGLVFTIHHEKCKYLNRLDPARFLEANFYIENKIEIRAFDRVGLSRDYTTVIAYHGLNFIREFGLKHSYDKNNRRIVSWKFVVETNAPSEINKLIIDLKTIPNIFSVKELKVSPQLTQSKIS